MTTAQLIDALSDYDPDTPVFVHLTGAHYWRPIEAVGLNEPDGFPEALLIEVGEELVP